MNALDPHPDPQALFDQAKAEYEGGEDLGPVPGSLVETRLALHSVAEQVLKPAREAATGNEIALRWYPGGVGTPPFSDDHGHRVIRVEGLELVDECDGSTRREPLTSLAATGKLVGDLVDTSGLSEEPLAIDPAAATFLARWFAFATFVISRARIELGTPENEPGWVQLWPEHFDIATELGAEAAGARAAFGASPGDEAHDEPYVYVAPWSASTDGEQWNSTAFGGAELGYSEMLGSSHPAATAAEFFAARLEDLTGQQ